jgi:hypothetical protein
MRKENKGYTFWFAQEFDSWNRRSRLGVNSFFFSFDVTGVAGDCEQIIAQPGNLGGTDKAMKRHGFIRNELWFVRTSKRSNLLTCWDISGRSGRAPSSPGEGRLGARLACKRFSPRAGVHLSRCRPKHDQIRIFVRDLKWLYHKEDNHLLIFCVLSRDCSLNISQKI